MRFILLTFAVFAVFAPFARTLAATYYVDFDAGSDAAAGTSTGTAWKSIPGTRTTTDTGYRQSAWGSITSAARIADGDIIKLKGGTVHTNDYGGHVWLTGASGGFYDFGYTTGIVIETDTGWGTGNAVLDGRGMTVGIALVLSQIDGVTFRGLTIQECQEVGLQIKEKGGASPPCTNIVIGSCTFIGNGRGLTNDLAGSGKGQISVRRAQNLTITNCFLNGDTNFINGVLLGNNGWAVNNGWVANNRVINHRGDLAGNDSGIGFKTLNSAVTFTNCISTNNLKGWDCGEQSAPGNWNVTVIDSVAGWNAWGINFNNSFAGTVNYYAINNLVFSNSVNGFNCYAGPFNLHIIHNTVWGNGSGAAGTAGNIRVNNDNPDRTVIAARILNNNFFKPSGASENFYNHYFKQNVDSDYLSMECDYNSWVQTASEAFATWAGSEGAPDTTTYSYGANGPGKASGNWYSWYSYSTTPPTNGATGHFQSDANSKGTGATDTTSPPFTSIATQDATLTASYVGTSLSGKSWYTSNMGRDRAGIARTTWDIGAYEFNTAITTTARLGTGKAVGVGRR